jgi:hypothetical protein
MSCRIYRTEVRPASRNDLANYRAVLNAKAYEAAPVLRGVIPMVSVLERTLYAACLPAAFDFVFHSIASCTSPQNSQFCAMSLNALLRRNVSPENFTCWQKLPKTGPAFGAEIKKDRLYFFPNGPFFVQ